MSQWHGGKGDKSRVSNLHEYNTNYDRIFRKSMKPSYKLFLDDYRVPEKAWLHDSDCYLLTASSTRKWDWEVVRNYRAFRAIVDNKGIPEVVSFDNDLNEDHMVAFHKTLGDGIYEWENLTETGIHCVLYLIEKCKEQKVPFPKYYIHSANHFARPIIKKLIDDYTDISGLR